MSTTRTALFARVQPGGVFTVEDLPDHPGAVFFVDSTCATGADSVGAGRSPDIPFLTLSYALSSDVCTASKGDVIYLMPGHVETCIAAGTITADIAGVKIVGLGEGNLRPTISFTTAAAASFLVSAANVTIENIIFDLTGVDSLNNPLNITGAGCTVKNCEFEHADATGQADYAIVTAATANDLVIEDCYFFGSGDAGTTAAIHLVGGDSAKIQRNKMFGAYTAGAGGILNDTTAATNLLVEDNVIDNRTANSTKAIVVDNATTGVIRGNSLSILNGTAPITAAAMVWTGNRYAAAAGAVSVEMDTVSVSAASLATDSIDADALAADGIAEIADGVFDEVITGHVTAATAGAMLQSLHSGAAQAGAAGNIQLAATASATNDIYNGCVVQIIGGTGAGQTRLIYDYTGGTTTALVTPNWTTNPAADSVYVIRPVGQVRVDYVTDGVIGAGSFAAGAIDAAAIANAAIDAATFAADAIANAAIADGAFSDEQFDVDAAGKLVNGVEVVRATAALPQGVAADIFTITGGPIKLLDIIGTVTAQVGNVPNATKLQVNPAGAGATTDICATTDIDSANVGATMSITGTLADNLVLSANIPFVAQATSIVCPEGTIVLDCDGSDGGGGRVKWVIHYIPLEAGVTVAST